MDVSFFSDDKTKTMVEDAAPQKRFPTWIFYLLPSVLCFFVFTIYPFIKTVVTSLFITSNTGALTKFVGIGNYIGLFQNARYLQCLGNTVKYMLLTVPLTIIIALLLAVLTSTDYPGMGIFRTIFSSTMGISVAAGSVFWSLIFNPTSGLLNKVISGLGFDKVGWLTEENVAMYSISLVSVWMNIGFAYLILMGAIKSIDSSHYESVDIVGGGFFYKLFKVTIPLISPSLFLY